MPQAALGAPAPRVRGLAVGGFGLLVAALPGAGATRIAALSPDGSAALLSETGDAGGAGYAAYLRRTDGSPPVRLGTGVATSLSPDGRIALAVPLDEPTRIDATPTGPGETRQIRFAGIVQYEWASFTPDGTHVVFVGRTPDQNLRVWVGAENGGAARPITPDGLTLSRDLVSPDSRSLVGPCRPRIFCLDSLAEGGDAPHAVPGLARPRRRRRTSRSPCVAAMVAVAPSEPFRPQFQPMGDQMCRGRALARGWLAWRTVLVLEAACWHSGLRPLLRGELPTSLPERGYALSASSTYAGFIGRRRMTFPVAS